MHPTQPRPILIVTGAHLRAEAADRPIAYRLQQRLDAWLARQFSDAPGATRVLVCSDLWYLNDNSLRSHPAISIGGPAVNAFTAFLADKLPSAFTVEDLLIVQADLDFLDIIACCWGRDAAATAAAVDAFTQRYLDPFMQAATQTTAQ